MRGSLCFACIILLLSYFSLNANGVTVSYDDRALLINGERRLILSGSIHYTRSTPEMWPDLMNKAKEGGLNTIETYTFWNAHEPLYREYDFSGNLDLVRYIKEIQAAGLYAILRIGPYVCAEWNFGGFPGWLDNLPNITFRTDNDAFKNEMKIFTTKIVDMMRAENLFASQGGPIILAQIENEYGDVMAKYGDDGKKYIQWCADLAQSYEVGVPWIMCQQADAPKGMINTCNGFYCDQFKPNPGVPKMWTENWVGWFKNWGGQFPRRTAEDVSFAAARFFQYGGTMQNYYMYHGGTNFGRSAGGPYIATTYDYDAPLDEYGNKNQPKWGHLKKLHHLLLSMEKTLTHGVVKSIAYQSMVDATIYDDNGERACFFGNANNDTDATIEFEGKNYTIPAWSVTILPDCKTEAYNTAQVNAQTSIMVRTSTRDINSYSKIDKTAWQWSWKSENYEDLHLNKLKKNTRGTKGYIYANRLHRQTRITNDTSDYLWYMTSANIDHTNPDWREDVTLTVHTDGHVLHVFINGDHVGTQWAKDGSYSFDFESNKFKTRNGMNRISLLSVTVGRQNYGAYLDKTKVGITGKVSLISSNGNIMDLHANKWVYKVGLSGLDESGLIMENKRFEGSWKQENIPTNKMFVWYKSSFETPAGKDPVVLDLRGLGKGMAWVNGNSIGRYWPSYYANSSGCSPNCDYRGKYGGDKCQTGCGRSSQRWYHVPRSFLRPENNMLVLFEEFGGDPSNVNIKTVTAKSIIGNAYQEHELELSCHEGKVISEIKFASFGDPKQVGTSFVKGTCESSNSKEIVEKACLGKESCTIKASETSFILDGCESVPKRLAVEALC